MQITDEFASESFGLGVERLTAQMLKLKNVREASLTPRDPDRLVP